MYVYGLLRSRPDNRHSRNKSWPNLASLAVAGGAFFGVLSPERAAMLQVSDVSPTRAMNFAEARYPRLSLVVDYSPYKDSVYCLTASIHCFSLYLYLFGPLAYIRHVRPIQDPAEGAGFRGAARWLQGPAQSQREDPIDR